MSAAPAWAHKISRLHGHGLLSADAYDHPRVGRVSNAFCRRLRRIEARAFALRCVTAYEVAQCLRRGAARFGFRGATDFWMQSTVLFIGSIRSIQERSLDRARQRRAVWLIDRIRAAFDDLQAGRVGN